MEKQILELLIGLDTEVKGMRGDVNDLKSETTSIRSEMTGMKTEMGSMKTEMGSMKTEMGSMKTEMDNMKTEMHERFNTVEAKLDGIGGQFELTNELRMNDFDFIDNKVNRLEKEIFIMKSKSNR
ncbi:hypothetical protein FZC76_14720 [Sutcliffiella horikoshii]|uniref:Uncharacterized protein n=1 Tax=Sutcliffiella horikoshii TaxID=79883 RepID=A0A5D4SWQ5_9BACI|nr:hypothetical protein [Sutcliffiella horikoshii]TYS67810.1 hypothetical protein FZC76_14720 [Sutcliffiella horikoshii]